MQHKAINGIGPAGKGARQLATERELRRYLRNEVARRDAELARALASIPGQGSLDHMPDRVYR